MYDKAELDFLFHLHSLEREASDLHLTTTGSEDRYWETSPTGYAADMAMVELLGRLDGLEDTDILTASYFRWLVGWDPNGGSSQADTSLPYLPSGPDPRLFSDEYKAFCVDHNLPRNFTYEDLHRNLPSQVSP